jgi:hypothetical protein
MSIVIAGSRAGRTVQVSGTTKGVEAGSELVAWARLGTAVDFAPGRKPAIVRDGEFTWQRRASRAVTLYFEFEGTSSNRVTIPAHARSTRGR